jgi:hypothetical protein
MTLESMKAVGLAIQLIEQCSPYALRGRFQLLPVRIVNRKVEWTLDCSPERSNLGFEYVEFFVVLQFFSMAQLIQFSSQIIESITASRRLSTPHGERDLLSPNIYSRQAHGSIKKCALGCVSP